ncbi:hypothetical protein [Sphingomonas phyllosphaerae]|uniref:hypothetical protein n=1 Tax=Sphingomonas phyllosphaerae TaxID=257003 RepID=UPI002413C4B6|nr:hypothetical protein [Sphingomonas phyllosphaerae]
MALIGFGTFMTWFFGLIIVGEEGYASQYFWVSGCAFAVGSAVAPFWRLRRLAWYWCTIAFLTAANLSAVYVLRERAAEAALPSKGIVQLMLVFDGLVCWVVMVGVCFAIYRRFPWQMPGMTAED